jgi:hypothetical protein
VWPLKFVAEQVTLKGADNNLQWNAVTERLRRPSR